MKKLIIVAAVLVLGMASSQPASANDRGLNGLIIGGGSGAIVGQAIGRNTEATIIGATVGGVLGLIVGNEIDRQQVSVNRYRYEPRHHPRTARKWNRSYHQPQKRCERIVTIEQGRHFDQRVVKTVCWEEREVGRRDFRPSRHDRFYR